MRKLISIFFSVLIGASFAQNTDQKISDSIATDRQLNPFGGRDSDPRDCFRVDNDSSDYRFRKVVQEVVLDKTEFRDTATFSFKVVITQEGDVVSVQTIKARTTTADQILINKVKLQVMDQLKYEEIPGSPLMQKIYTVYLNEQPE